MKLKMYLALLAMGMLSLQGCNDDDDDLPNSKVPEAVRNAFDSSFSNTANLSWETQNCLTRTILQSGIQQQERQRV